MLAATPGHSSQSVLLQNITARRRRLAQGVVRGGPANTRHKQRDKWAVFGAKVGDSDRFGTVALDATAGQANNSQRTAAQAVGEWRGHPRRWRNLKGDCNGWLEVETPVVLRSGGISGQGGGRINSGTASGIGKCFTQQIDYRPR